MSKTMSSLMQLQTELVKDKSLSNIQQWGAQKYFRDQIHVVDTIIKNLWIIPFQKCNIPDK